MLIQAKPLAAICWLVQPGHLPASTWAMSQHQSPMYSQTPPGLIHGLNTGPAGSGHWWYWDARGV